MNLHTPVALEGLGIGRNEWSCSCSHSTNNVIYADYGEAISISECTAMPEEDIAVSTSARNRAAEKRTVSYCS